MKNWLLAIMAALIVVGAGTAIASIPNGSDADFSVSDPAVTVLASGEGTNGGSYGEGTTFFLEQPAAMTFTAAADGVCQVALDGQVLRNTGNGARIQYGVAIEDGEGTSFVGQSGITTTLGDFGGTNDAADLGRTVLVPIEAGETYTFGFGVTAPAGSSGTAFPNENYVCFGG